MCTVFIGCVFMVFASPTLDAVSCALPIHLSQTVFITKIYFKNSDH